MLRVTFPNTRYNGATATNGVLDHSGAATAGGTTPRLTINNPGGSSRLDLSGSRLDLGREEEEMEQESARMRRELEERAMRAAASPHNLSARSAAQLNSEAPAKSSIVSQLNPGYQTQSMPAVTNPSQLDASQIQQQQTSQLDTSVLSNGGGVSAGDAYTVHKQRLQLQKEMKSLQQNMAKGRLEIKSLETQIKENRAKAEDARTEVMLAEFKRDSARKELETVLQQIHLQRGELRRIEEELDEEESEEERVNLAQQQLSEAQSVRAQLEERVRSLESQLRELAGAQQQCEDLSRQLTEAKQSQAGMQQQLDELKQAAKTKETELKELTDKQATAKREGETRAARLEEMTSERDTLRRQHDKLDARFKQMEHDKNQLIKEKSQEYDELKSRLTEQLTQVRANNSKELHELRVQLTTLNEQNAQAQANAHRHEESAQTSKEQVLSLEQKLSEQTERYDVTREESQRALSQLTQEKETAIRELGEQLESSKAEALQRMRSELEEQAHGQVSQLQSKHGAELRQRLAEMADKEVEIQVLKDKVKQQEAITRQVGEKIRSEAQERFVKLMKEERVKWEREKDGEVQQLLGSMRDEMEKTSCRLREELDAERKQSEDTVKQMSSLRQELEEEKDQSRQMYREKLANLNHAKESVALEKQRELDAMRERLEQETHKTIESLRETVARQEEELNTLREERAAAANRERSQASQADSQERQILNEITEECRRVTSVLGKSVYNAYPAWSVSGGQMRAQLAGGLASLRAANEELRKYVQELKYEVEAHKQSLAKLERTKSEALEEQRRRMQQEKLQALESLKDRLIKEHLDEVDKLQATLGRGGGEQGRSLRDKDKELRDIQHNMSAWKHSTTDKLARKFQEELHREVDKRSKETKRQQADWERERGTLQREVARLERELTRVSATAKHVPRTHPPLPNTPGMSTCSKQTLQRLQNQVRQLQAENTQLRRSKLGGGLSHSYGDITNTSFTDLGAKDSNKLSAQNSALESRARLAEERAQRNETLLNQKMTELSKLQGTLTQQTKELMQLERAYSQLQQKGLRPNNHTRVSFAT